MKKLREKIADAFDVPKDVALGQSKIVIIGEQEVNIENYHGILEYDTSIVRIKTADKIIRIIGSKLEIDTITDEDIQIVGSIKAVEWGAFECLP
ncbi:MAG: sporulation protein [Clostridiales bacterium]|nr:sporulation protein [Clostridiales bacterium]